MSRDFTPALRFRWLTALYDPLMERWTSGTALREAVIEALDLRPGLRLLELGCGPGRLAIEIKRRWPTVTIDALDRDPEILDVATRNAAAAGVDITFREADIANLSALGPYDRAYSTLVFHHLKPEDKRGALAGVRRSLAPDGMFVVGDFGRPRGRLQWALFSAVGWLDGIQNTAPHRDGRFGQQLRDAFGHVQSVAVRPTIFGTLEVFVCRP
ncbi:MAG: class I SAM-dependent methyltransferase [Armatimonadota bacterium]